MKPREIYKIAEQGLNSGSLPLESKFLTILVSGERSFSGRLERLRSAEVLAVQ